MSREVFYISQANIKLNTNATEQAMQADIEKLHIELAKAKEELAIAQTASSVDYEKNCAERE